MILYVWVTMMLLVVLFHLIGILIEKYVSEEHPLKKWWRKNVIDIDPSDI